MSYEFGLEGSIKVDDIKEEEGSSYWEGMKADFNMGDLKEGIGVDEEVRISIFSKNPDYKREQESYDAYSDMRRVYLHETAEETMRSQIDRTVAEGRWSLNEDGEVTDSNTEWINDGFMYDKKAIKGALLAQANGYSKEKHDAAYISYSNSKAKELANISDKAPFSSGLVGTMGQYFSSGEAIIEIAGSPSKVVGTTMMKTFAKRAGIEAGLVAFGGLGRERRKLEHAVKAELNYGLTDSATTIAIEAGFAGFFSGVVTIGLGAMSKGKWGDEWGKIDKEIVTEYVAREETKLTANAVKHEDLLVKTEMDIDSGKQADVGAELEIPISTKMPEDTPINSLDDAVNEVNLERGFNEDINKIRLAAEETPEYKDTDVEATYAGMIDDAEGDDFIRNVAKVDPEIEAELKALEAEEAALNTGSMNTLSAQGSGQLGGSMGGGTIGAMEGAYEEIVEGKDLTSEDYLARIVGGAVAGNMIGRTAKTEGTGMFAGGSAKSYESKLAQGKVTSSIYDKETRFWIDDIGAEISFKEKKKLRSNGYAKLSDLMSHDELYREYPELKDMKIYTTTDSSKGSFDGTNIFIDEKALISSLGNKDSESIILHEVQHAIQEIEGFAKGGAPEQFADSIVNKKIRLDVVERHLNEVTNTHGEQARKLSARKIDEAYAFAKKHDMEDMEDWEIREMYIQENDEVFKDLYKEQARLKRHIKEGQHGKYRRLAGEQEARMVQAKLEYPDLTPEEALKKYDKVDKLPEPIVQMDYADEAMAKSEDYKMSHTAPEPEGANSGDDLTDIFPDSPSDKNFERYYGTGDKASDKESIAAMKKMEGNPEADVTIYRAAPKGKEINEGDWITLSKNYAKEHGEAHMDGNYEILELNVKAKDVYTNGDSINEWGYYPQGAN